MCIFSPEERPIRGIYCRNREAEGYFDAEINSQLWALTVCGVLPVMM